MYFEAKFKFKGDQDIIYFQILHIKHTFMFLNQKSPLNKQKKPTNLDEFHCKEIFPYIVHLSFILFKDIFFSKRMKLACFINGQYIFEN